ncbi:hypothetical protein PISMIDRAFT_682407, partial [Pisolithus microcarpus 441]
MDQKSKRAGRYVDLRTCMHAKQYPHVSVVVLVFEKENDDDGGPFALLLALVRSHTLRWQLRVVPFSYRITTKYIRST